MAHPLSKDLRGKLLLGLNALNASKNPGLSEDDPIQKFKAGPRAS
jgi:hypothetical protein